MAITKGSMSVGNVSKTCERSSISFACIEMYSVVWRQHGSQVELLLEQREACGGDSRIYEGAAFLSWQDGTGAD